MTPATPSRRTVLYAGLAALATGPALAATSAWQAIMDRGTIRIGVLPSHGPYHDQQDGKWVGFAVQMGLDCMAALAAAMNKPLRPEYVETSLATVILDLQADRLDLYFGLTDSPQRRQAVTMFGPIYQLPECAINAAGFNPGANWADYDKPSITVSAVLGSTDQQAAQRMLPHATIRTLRSTAEAVMDIQSGNAQVMINTLLTGLMAHKTNPTLAAPLVLQPLVSQPSTGGTRKDTEGRLAAFLEDWAKTYRSSGRAKAVILDALNHFGLDAAALPPTLQF